MGRRSGGQNHLALPAAKFGHEAVEPSGDPRSQCRRARLARVGARSPKAARRATCAISATSRKVIVVDLDQRNEATPDYCVPKSVPKETNACVAKASFSKQQWRYPGAVHHLRALRGLAQSDDALRHRRPGRSLPGLAVGVHAGLPGGWSLGRHRAGRRRGAAVAAEVWFAVRRLRRPHAALAVSPHGRKAPQCGGNGREPVKLSKWRNAGEGEG